MLIFCDADQPDVFLVEVEEGLGDLLRADLRVLQVGIVLRCIVSCC